MERCNACLSFDRKLHPINNFRSLYGCLLDNAKSFSTWEELPCPLLCWECYQKLINVQKFQQNIIQAQDLLTKYHKKSVKKKVLKCLSSLGTIIKSQYDFVYQYNEHNESSSFSTRIHKSHLESNFESIMDIKQELDNEPNVELQEMDSDTETKMDLYADYELEALDEMAIKENEKFLSVHTADLEIDIKNELQSYSNTSKPKTVLPKKLSKTKKYKMLSIKKEDCISKCRNIKLDEAEMMEWRHKETEKLNCSRFQYKCEKCIVGFTTEFSYNKHMKKRHSKLAGEFLCSVCEIRLKSNQQLAKHTSGHYVKYVCTLCEQEFQGFQRVERHFQRTHVKVMQCLYCPLTFEYIRDVLEHHRQLHAYVVCDLCGRKYCAKQRLINHIKKKHQPIKCELCDKSYKDQYSLIRHKRKHHVVAPSEDTYCVECDISFDNELLYADHVKYSNRHVGKKTIPCPECGKVYAKRWNMMRHYDYVHTEKTRFYCEPCNRYFLNGFRLRTHTRSFHNKVRPPKNKICQYCNRGFSTNRILANHILTHTGERPHACPECPARFAQSTALKSHIKSQHIRPTGRLFLQMK